MISKLVRLAFRLAAFAAFVQWVRHNRGLASSSPQPASATTLVGCSPFTGDVNELTCTELFAKLEALAAEWSGDAHLAQQHEHSVLYGELRQALRDRCDLDATIDSKPSDWNKFRVTATPA